ncbi:DUF551 domain-containing protein [Escherichia coli]|uniref:DUF551 domain-containing protein n=1 Tax=Escherichia coli TaxID=562 RepID=UPI0030C662C9
MTTNNHPAHGPVSLNRLHQIREILSKAAAQSDGGNLGYAMADAVKVIDGAIAAFDAEPVAVINGAREPVLYGEHIGIAIGTHLYTAPPAPVVPTFDEWLEIRGNKPLGWVKDAMRESYDACRAAMLQAANSPVIPDCWVACSERMPEDGEKVLTSFRGGMRTAVCKVVDVLGHKIFVDELTLFNGVPADYWQPLPAAPQQEVKS